MNSVNSATPKFTGPPPQRAPYAHYPLTPRMKKLLEVANEHAAILGSGYLGTEHLNYAIRKIDFDDKDCMCSHGFHVTHHDVTVSEPA